MTDIATAHDFTNSMRGIHDLPEGAEVLVTGEIAPFALHDGQISKTGPNKDTLYFRLVGDDCTESLGQGAISTEVDYEVYVRTSAIRWEPGTQITVLGVLCGQYGERRMMLKASWVGAGRP